MKCEKKTPPRNNLFIFSTSKWPQPPDQKERKPESLPSKAPTIPQTGSLSATPCFQFVATIAIRHVWAPITQPSDGDTWKSGLESLFPVTFDLCCFCQNYKNDGGAIYKISHWSLGKGTWTLRNQPRTRSYTTLREASLYWKPQHMPTQQQPWELLDKTRSSRIHEEADVLRLSHYESFLKSITRY